MLTERLYYKDNYLVDFSARVLEVTQQDKLYAVELSHTAFYPEGGGQPSDIGLIDGVRVLEVKEKGGKILHMLSSPCEVGKDVRCSIDWDYRFSLMQNHTGEHIVSGVINSLYGFENTGFHMGKEAVTVDFSGELGAADLEIIEKKANEIIYSNIDTNVSFPSKDQLFELNYRSKKELSGDVRIVKVGSYDCCACCGIHVKSTGEVGIIKFISSQKYKGGTRITMLSGSRALEHFSKTLASVAEISVMLSSKPEDITKSVAQLKEETLVLKERLKKAVEVACALKVKSVEHCENNIFYSEDNLSKDEIRLIATGLSDKTKALVMVVSGTDENVYSYAICSSCIDTRPVTKDINTSFNGRGGGTNQLTQGTLTGDVSKMEQYFKSIVIE